MSVVTQPGYNWRLEQKGGLGANLGFLANAGRLGGEGSKEGRLLRQGEGGLRQWGRNQN